MALNGISVLDFTLVETSIDDVRVKKICSTWIITFSLFTWAYKCFRSFKIFKEDYQYMLLFVLLLVSFYFPYAESRISFFNRLWYTQSDRKLKQLSICALTHLSNFAPAYCTVVLWYSFGFHRECWHCNGSNKYFKCIHVCIHCKCISMFMRHTYTLICDYIKVLKKNVFLVSW